MKRVLWIISGVILLIVISVGMYAIYNMQDRHPDYALDLVNPEKQSENGVKATFSAGLAKVTITPELVDTWVDADSNARYEPDKGDSFIDNNNNGEFDAYWLAGFQNNRPATGVHDDIWARTVVWDDGNRRVALVVLDAIGFFHDDVIDTRKMVEEKGWKIDHLIISSTHNHEVPDLMGLWGNGIFSSGVNDDYMAFVKDRIVSSVGQAVENLRPAVVKVSRIDTTAADLVGDSRKPLVLDNAIHMMQFCDAETMEPFGLLMNWGNHPETVGSGNLQITADFAHYWLKGVEEGIVYDAEVKRPGLGVTAIFANGAVGGLMTSLRSDIYDPWLDQSFKRSTFDKARAQGHRLADLVLNNVESGAWETLHAPAIGLYARTFLFDLDNFLFRIAGALGVLDRGFVDFGKLRSEVDLVTMGPVWIMTIPGEINPEIINGGIEMPEGADYPGEIIEAPALRKLMRGKYNFVIGLANDEVGYIMPKSHWDVEEPFTYDNKKRPYGEINSLGSESGPTVYRQAKSLIDSVPVSEQSN